MICDHTEGIKKSWSLATLGCWQITFSGGWRDTFSPEDAEKVVRTAFDHGITTLILRKDMEIGSPNAEGSSESS